MASIAAIINEFCFSRDQCPPKLVDVIPQPFVIHPSIPTIQQYVCCDANFLVEAFNPVAKVIPNYSSATGPAGITKGSAINFKFKVIWPRGQPVNAVDILLFMIGRVIPPLIANHSVILSLIFFSDIFHTLSHMLIIL